MAMNFYEISSIAFLAVLPLILIVPCIRAFRLPSEYSTLEKLLYAPVYCCGRLLWRVELANGKKICEVWRGGGVIIANHRSSLDPFFLQLASGRRIHWMVAGEYFKNPLFGPILRLFQAIPTNRSGADNAAIKRAIRLAADGRLVGMFPEGRINRTKQPLLKIRQGAGLVASKSNTPLVPVWISGAPVGWAVWSGLFLAAHVKIFVGRPMLLSDENLERSVTEAVQEAMESALALGGYNPKFARTSGKARSTRTKRAMHTTQAS